ncbi:MAG: hypothetical protein E7241_05225 [Lachnospiraceae bacterium]|jgi:ribosomal protein S27E|nr:hypothetical protein [Lachnospiraceae bacterium]
MENLRENTGPYKGFLIIKCEKCGEIKGFCTKQETYAFRCEECGHETALEELKPLYVECGCGAHFRYMTNIDMEELKWECLTCHTPLDIHINKRRTAYVTAGAGDRRRR